MHRLLGRYGHIPCSHVQPQTDVVPLPPEAVLTVAPEALLPDIQAGATVRTGQALGGGMYAPVTGNVISVTALEGLDGMRSMGIYIQTAEDEWDPTCKPVSNWETLPVQDLRRELARLGYTFTPNLGVVVASGMDKDPQAVVQRQALLKDKEAIILGLRILLKAVEKTTAFLAIPKDLVQSTSPWPVEQIRLAPLPAVYPNGLPEVIRHKIPSLRSAGTMLFITAERLAALARSVESGKPPVDKTITVTGPGLDLTKNLTVRMGTPVSAILRHLQIKLPAGARVLLGGTMAGNALPSLTRTPGLLDDCLTWQFDDGAVETSWETGLVPCMNCGRCSETCPVNLPANIIARYAEYDLFSNARDQGAGLCVECGLCDYVCPARRPLVHLIHFAKTETMDSADKPDASNHPCVKCGSHT